MRILVCGGRDFNDRKSVFASLDRFRETTDHVISGDASGADSLAHQWAASRNIPSTRYAADWRKHGKAAGPIRNRQMLEDGKPDMVIAFPGGRGTADMIRQARAAGVTVIWG